MDVYTVHVCVCVCVCMCYVCTYTQIYIMYPCLHQEETNMITATSHIILSHYDESRQTNKHPQFMPCQYLPFNCMHTFSYIFLVQTVCACYVHSRWLVVWILQILFNDDLIHLLFQDEFLECRLQNINVTSFLTELTFTQMFKI